MVNNRAALFLKVYLKARDCILFQPLESGADALTAEEMNVYKLIDIVVHADLPADTRSSLKAYLITTGACFNDWIKDVKNGISIEGNVIPDNALESHNRTVQDAMRIKNG